MTKTLQTIWFFVGMVAAVGASSFGVFKWMDKQQDTDSIQTEWMARQDSIQVHEAGFHDQVILEIRGNRTLIDSAIVIGWENRKVIVANKNVILEVIEADSSISKVEMMDMMKEYMNENETPSNRILNMDFPAGWIMQPSTDLRIIDHNYNR